MSLAWTSPGRTSPTRQTSPGRTSPARTSPTRRSQGRTSPVRTSAMRSSPRRRSPWGQNSPRRISPGRYSGRPTSRMRTSPRRTFARRTSPGRTSPGANLYQANLCKAELTKVHLLDANLSGANLTLADLSGANLVGTNFERADLTGCRVYGISAWDLKLDGAEQKNLIITPEDAPEITVDNLEVAQFIYLLLNNERVRHLIDTITSKVVLILGRFTPERKAVLDALREELRQRDFTPVLFDFDKPASKDLTGTVQTLANMARFVIADLTDPSSVPHELAMVVPDTPVAVQPVLLEGQREYAMFVDLRKRHHWVLEPYSYAS